MKDWGKFVTLGSFIILLMTLSGCGHSTKVSSSEKTSTSATVSTKRVKKTATSTTQDNSSAMSEETIQSQVDVSANQVATSESQSASQQPLPVAMNLSEIRSGSYASLNGTWTNGLGQTILVADDVMSFSDVVGQGQAGTVAGLTLDVPNWDGADGTPESVPFMGGTHRPQYNQMLIPTEYQGIISLKSELPSAVLYISFLPKGIIGEIQGGRIDQEKIIAVGTQNTPTAVPENRVYYRNN
jgi:hypothetical protein